MNMQALMRQAQNMQKELTKAKEEIDKTIFEGKSSLVVVSVNGKKEVLSIKFSDGVKDIVDDLSMLEDMVLLALNDAFSKVDKFTEEKMGKYTNMMPGLF